MSFGQTHTTAWLRDFRRSLPRRFQHLVRRARRFHNDRKPHVIEDAWREEGPWMDFETAARQAGEDPDDYWSEHAETYVPGSFDHHGHGLMHRVEEIEVEGQDWPERRHYYKELPAEWRRHNKEDLFEISARRNAEAKGPDSQAQQDLMFMRMAAGSATEWFLCIRDCKRPEAMPAGQAIDQAVMEMLGQLNAFDVAGVSQQPTGDEAAKLELARKGRRYVQQHDTTAPSTTTIWGCVPAISNASNVSNVDVVTDCINPGSGPY